MIRLVLFLIVIAALSLGISIIAEEPGKVAIDWGVYHIEASVLTLIGVVAVLALACLVAYLVLFYLIRSPKQWAKSRQARRQLLGLTALTETFAAIASQDVRGAKRYLKRAEGLLPDQPLTLMLASQVARLDGNDSKSQLYLERMSKTSVTEFIALRGMIDNARRSGDIPLALHHAEKAYEMKPHDHWLATTLIALYTAQDKMDEALRVLEKSARRRVLHADEVHQLRAAILCAHADVLARQQQVKSSVAMLRTVLKRYPAYVPAIMGLVKAYLSQDDVSMALKVAGDGWKRLPHPEIVDLLLACFDKAKDKPKAAKVLRKLAKYHADHDEAQVLMAGLAARQDENESAVGILKHVLKSTGETARLCTLLAELEHAQGNHDQEAYWHRRAKESPSGAVWHCDACKLSLDAWRVDCPQCGAVGSVG